VKINIVTGFFLPVPPVSGGATEKIWYRLAEEFAHRGHEVTFLSRMWPGFAEREIVNGVTHLRFPGDEHTRSLPRNLWRDFRWGMRLSRNLPPAHVTICNTVLLPIWLKRLRRSAGAVIPVVARMPKGQTRFYGNVDLLFSLSRAVRDAIGAENPKLKDRIAPFPFPIDWRRHALAAENARGSRRGAPLLTIGYVGRIHPEKGIDLLLRAAARLATRGNLPAWRLVLIGPSSVPAGGGGEGYKSSLISNYSPLLGDRLRFEGPEFEPAKLAARYAQVDVFCYPSIAETGETFGVSVAEAMAAGCAPIVSALDCFRELVIHGQTGLVFDHRAADADDRLANEIERLLRDAQLRRLVADRAQQHVRQYDFMQVADLVLNHLSRFQPVAAQIRG
jgi:glycosyltransferase involved in cell wall biosynthesis